LGEGSNVLFGDRGFDGYVIRPIIKGVDYVENESDMDSETTLVVAGAGEHWDDVVASSVSKNLSGLENMSWIPGSVGAAPVQNIGAYGAEIKEIIEWIEVFDPTTEKVKRLSRAECNFGYRDSFFKTTEGKGLVILRVAMRLQKNALPNISYKDLANYFSTKNESPTISEVRDAVIKIRQSKLPDVHEVGTAGSFFKNPIVSANQFETISKDFPGIPSFPVDAGFGVQKGGRKIPLAWILDKVCGLNDYREGNVGLYKTQPLALVNFGGATTDEIKKFAKKVSDIVREKTGIKIEWEVNLVE
jgi:UDP-N-acetylmuramate dehydrogenase